MVKLPAEDLEYHFQNLREWVYRYQTNREQLIRPIRLMELEEFSELAANYMQINIVPTSPETHNRYRQTAMDRIRQLFNMEFKLRCDVCGTAHRQDEITAPER